MTVFFSVHPKSYRQKLQTIYIQPSETFSVKMRCHQCSEYGKDIPKRNNKNMM